MWQFAQYSTSTSTSASGSASLAVIIVYLVLFVVYFAAAWKINTKAGEAGWKSLIPIYNIYILLKIAGLPVWYLILLLVPLVNIVVLIVVYHKLSKAFGYGVGMTILLCLTIGSLIIGFGKAKYLGPDGKADANLGQPPAPPATGPQPPAGPPTTNPLPPQQPPVPPAPTAPPTQPLVQ